jgi:hypothetical protein
LSLVLGRFSSQVGKYRDFALPKEPFAQNLTSCGELEVKRIKKREIYKTFVFMFILTEPRFCG